MNIKNQKYIDIFGFMIKKIKNLFNVKLMQNTMFFNEEFMN